MLAVAGALYAFSATLTIVWCAPMSAMAGMQMPGGWTMSMAWMRMPGQTWTGAMASALGMWVVMMAAMMTPSFVPMLLRYRVAVARAGDGRLGLLSTLVAAGYFGLWSLIGLVVLSLGFVLAEAEMRYPALSRSIPFATAAVLVVAGASQWTRWKAHHLACCRRGALGTGRALRADAVSAVRQGVRLGRHCLSCSAGLTAVLLVLGVMDLGVMAAVTAAITAERLVPAAELATRAIGAVVMSAGVVQLAISVTRF